MAIPASMIAVGAKSQLGAARAKRFAHGALRYLREQAFAAFLWSVLISAYDVWLCHERSFGSAPDGSLAILALLSMGIVLTWTWPLAAIRSFLRDYAGSNPLSRACAASLDGVLLAYWLCWRQRYVTLDAQTLWLVAGILVTGSAFSGWFAGPFRRGSRIAYGLVSCAALAIEAALPTSTLPWVHFALDMAAAAGALPLFTLLTHRLDQRFKLALCALSLALILAAPIIVRRSGHAHALLIGYSTHARVHAQAAATWFLPKPGKGPGRLGPRACKRNPDCKSNQAPSSRLSGSAKGADILLLSSDALRWDQAQAVQGTLDELGPHTRFHTAVSPGVRTVHSLGALLRGRPVRQVPFSRAGSQTRALKPTATETLASVFARNGYRAVLAPTRRFLSGSFGMTTGFEELSDGPGGGRTPSFGALPLGQALARILTAAAQQDQPLLAWAHALETHEPYTWPGGSGPATLAGQSRAAQSVSETWVDFLRKFRAARRNRPLIVAIFADHGEEFGEHGGQYHSSSVHAEQVRVTFALKAPGLPAQDVRAPVSLSALPATLFDLAGIETPCTFTVPSLLPCLADPTQCPELAVSELMPFASSDKRLIGYTSADHRLLYDRGHHITKLFDSRDDPYERRDLVNKRPDLARAMRSKARAWDAQFCVPPEKMGAPKDPPKPTESDRSQAR